MELKVYISRNIEAGSRSFVSRAYRIHSGRTLENDDWIFGAWGKPAFACKASPRFNLSHSGEYICCVFAEEEIGIDIQRIRSVPRNIVKRYFDECLSDSVDQICAWTMMESFYKRIGTGLPEEGLKTEYTGFFLHDYRIKDYVITVSTERQYGAIDLIEI